MVQRDRAINGEHYTILMPLQTDTKMDHSRERGIVDFGFDLALWVRLKPPAYLLSTCEINLLMFPLLMR